MFLNPGAVDREAVPTTDGVAATRSFHAGLAGYAPTPLIELPDVAEELGVGRLLIKDESRRLGLPAFKILGASWAIARLIAARIGLSGDLTVPVLRSAVRRERISFTCATDGNHGRAVARMAAWLEADCTVFVPELIDRRAVESIASEGAQVAAVAGNYDQAVSRAAEHAAATGAELVQDTAWDGYEQVPAWVAEGYGTMLAEIDEHAAPDLVVVPVGVGSLAHAVVVRYAGRAHIASVEPDSADCIRRSLFAGYRVTVNTGRTAMAGLNCGTPSTLAWPFLQVGLSAAVAVSEAQAAAAVDDLAARGLSSGPCGAAALAAARLLPREQLALDTTSTVVLLSTEGDNP